MSEPEPAMACSRCDERIDPEATLIAIERGPLHEKYPALRLCPRCTESLTIWLEKYHGVWAPADHAGSRPRSPGGHTSSRDRQRHGRGSKPRGRRVDRLKPFLFGGLVCVLVAALGCAVVVLLIRRLHSS
jgi:hypothetical protein